MHKTDLFVAIFDYIENLFSMKLEEREKQSIKDSFDSIHVADGMERAIKAIEMGLHVRLPQDLFIETRVHRCLDPIEDILKRLNFEASMWTSEYHNGVYATDMGEKY